MCETSRIGPERPRPLQLHRQRRATNPFHLLLSPFFNIFEPCCTQVHHAVVLPMVLVLVLVLMLTDMVNVEERTLTKSNRFFFSTNPFCCACICREPQAATHRGQAPDRFDMRFYLDKTFSSSHKKMEFSMKNAHLWSIFTNDPGWNGWWDLPTLMMLDH